MFHSPILNYDAMVLLTSLPSIIPIKSKTKEENILLEYGSVLHLLLSREPSSISDRCYKKFELW